MKSPDAAAGETEREKQLQKLMDARGGRETSLNDERPGPVPPANRTPNDRDATALAEFLAMPGTSADAVSGVTAESLAAAAASADSATPMVAEGVAVMADAAQTAAGSLSAVGVDHPAAEANAYASADLAELVQLLLVRLGEFPTAPSGGGVASPEDADGVLTQVGSMVRLVEAVLAGQKLASVLTERVTGLHEDLVGVRGDVEQLRGEVDSGDSVGWSALDELCKACLRVAVVTLACCVIGGPAAGLALHQPVLEKAVEGAIGGFVAAAATELGLHMTEDKHKPLVDRDIAPKSEPSTPYRHDDIDAEIDGTGIEDTSNFALDNVEESPEYAYDEGSDPLDEENCEEITPGRSRRSREGPAYE